MNLLNEFRNYALEEKFKIIYLDRKLDIINYTDIVHFDNNKIIINYKQGVLTISGKNLVISKLLSDELLIEGTLEKVIFNE